jgi:hypothetical protein
MKSQALSASPDTRYTLERQLSTPALLFPQIAIATSMAVRRSISSLLWLVDRSPMISALNARPRIILAGCGLS